MRARVPIEEVARDATDVFVTTCMHGLRRRAGTAPPGNLSFLTGSSSITFSAFHVPKLTRYSNRHIALLSAAPTNPIGFAGSCRNRTSSGIATAPRSNDCRILRFSQSQTWIFWPYLPAFTSSKFGPG